MVKREIKPEILAYRLVRTLDDDLFNKVASYNITPNDLNVIHNRMRLVGLDHKDNDDFMRIYHAALIMLELKNPSLSGEL